MWPKNLQMSDDDCRSTLRRLELETYSNVIGVFRAQGGLSDRKTKLLEELRSVFHISQDRHRAESRRVVNDEVLSTIAKAVSGPNTWQEWAREGRRSYPMLPRVAPQTALGWIANKLANEVAIENAKLPLPAETAAAAAEEQAAIFAANAATEAANLCYAEKYIVTSDPFKTPDIPAAGIKKNLKRGMTDGHQVLGTSSNKKRSNVSDTASTNKHNKHITGTANTSSTNNNRKTAALNRIQQQRFFYQQQQKAKKLAKAAANKREKPAGASKCGRKSKKFKEQQRLEQEYQQQQQDLLQQQQQLLQQQQQQQDFEQYENFTSTNFYSNINVNNPNETFVEDSKFTSNQKPIYLPLIMPQIAASKRDITRNLTKLQIPGNSPSSSTQSASSSIGSPISAVGKSCVGDTKLTTLSTPVQKYIVEDRQPPSLPQPPGSITQHSQITNLPINVGNATAAGANTATPTTQTTQFITVPNLPVSNKLRPVSTTILPAGTKLTTTAATTTKKLSGATILSATLLSPGSTNTSLMSETLLNNANASATTTATTTQLFMEGNSNAVQVQSNSNQANISTSSLLQQQQQPPPTAPTHTPPAVIQLHSNEVVRLGHQQQHQQQQQQSISTTTTPSQSKVLTTKILPIVFGNSSSSTGNSIKNGNANATGASNFISNPPGTIIKSLSSPLLISGQHQHSGNLTSSGSASFSNFGSTGQVYRKHPNILKSTSSLRSSANNSGGPQIISNIRLTPASINSTATGPTTSTNATNPTQSNIFQQQLRISPSSTGIRTSVKICQSPNGKVFIQPANVDPTKITKITSSQLAQRLLPSNLLGSNSSNCSNIGGSSSSNTNVSPLTNFTTNQPGSPHRIAIQKVQIIPSPLSTNASQNPQHRLGAPTTTLSLGGNNKTKFEFNPNTGSLRPTKSLGALTFTKGSFSSNSIGGLNDSSTNSSGTNYSKQSNASTNVVVIDASSNNKLNSQNLNVNSKSISTSNLNINRSINNSHMITEDTPVDIIVDGSTDITTAETTTTTPSLANVNETSSITAVLASNLMENTHHHHHHQHHHQIPEKQTSTTTTTMVPITVLSTTDWEMELDQATAASSMHQQQQQHQLSGSSIEIPKLHEQSESELETADTIIIDDSFEDVIIEEEEEEEVEGEDIGEGGLYMEEEQDETAEELTHVAHDLEVATENDIIMVDDIESFDGNVKVDKKDEGDELERDTGDAGLDYIVEEIPNENAEEISYRSLSNSISEDNNAEDNLVPPESLSYDDEENDQKNLCSTMNNEECERLKQENDNISEIQSTLLPLKNYDEEINETQSTSSSLHHIHNHNEEEEEEKEEDPRISPTLVIEKEIHSSNENDICLVEESDQEEIMEGIPNTTLTTTTTAPPPSSASAATTTTVRTIATTVSASLVSVQDFDEPKTNLVKNNDENETETSEGTNCSTRDDLHLQTTDQ